MSGDRGTSPAMGMARFTLRVQDTNLEVSAELPEGPVLPAVLLPVLQNLSNSMTELVTRRAGRAGERISCSAGCGACCRQAVPISPVEAREIAQWLGEQEAGRQAELRERFRAAVRRLEEAGIAQRLRESSRMESREAAHALGSQYFSLGIACPFLEEESCSIHEIRPLRCREYLVVSPAEHCAHPETLQIVNVKPPVLLSRILERWDASGDAKEPELLLLAMLEEWMEKHPAEEDAAHRTAPELLQDFLRAFAKDAAAPADAKGSPEMPA